MENGSAYDHIISTFAKNREVILNHANGLVKGLRVDAFNRFKERGLPTKKHEEWKYTDIAKYIDPGFTQYYEPLNHEFNIDEIFKCDVPDLDTITITLLNGYYPKTQQQLTTLDNGVIYGGFAAALAQHSDLVEKHYTRAAACTDSIEDLNTAFARDGIFIYVPDRVVMEQPIQIINIVHNPEDLIIHHRNMFIAGKNAQVNIVICEHSLFFNKSFISSVTEVFAEESSHVGLFRIQNSSNNTSLFSSTNIMQKKHSYVLACTISLHGGFIRNNTNVELAEKYCETALYGLYLADREQHVDNHIFVDHAAPNCKSNQVYKGIIDNDARAVFSGKILVRKDAQKTDARQTNKNILMSETAKADSKPQLVIYADDVKCSHGATMGQLDEDAMFYLRSRGIPKDEARTLLMYAFASEIIREIKVPALRERMDDLVAKRVRGELSRCNHCMIKCN